MLFFAFLIILKYSKQSDAINSNIIAEENDDDREVTTTDGAREETIPK